MKPHIKLIDRREQYTKKLKHVKSAEKAIRGYLARMDRDFIYLRELKPILTPIEFSLYMSQLKVKD